jgi:hypothetical protein
MKVPPQVLFNFKRTLIRLAGHEVQGRKTVIQPLRSSPHTTVASPNPDSRLNHRIDKGIRGTTETAESQTKA